jgi:hypothetical protein
MTQEPSGAIFEATLLRPADSGQGESWAFVVLPKHASDKLARRGRTTVNGSINGVAFQETLEPDGQMSHWLKVSARLREAAGANFGSVVVIEVIPLEQEPEPDLPADLWEALQASPDALEIWQTATTVARLDWIHWVSSAKQATTRAKRIADACEMLAGGKRRVCCFDPSGYYSKAFKAPQSTD